MNKRVLLTAIILSVSMLFCILSAGAVTATASSQHVGNEASKAVDGDPATIWHTEWTPMANLPQWITLDLGSTATVTGLEYTPRTNHTNGIVTQYNIFVSTNGSAFSLVKTGSWSVTYAKKTISFNPVQARYVKLEVTGGSGGYASAAEIEILQTSTGGTGQILRQWWSGISGTLVSYLTGNVNYPYSPTGSEILTSFEGPTNSGSNYGSRIIGYVHPSVSGSYTFWLASDDSGELWLSTDTNPANRKLIATVNGWTSSKQWDKFTSQKSAPVTLTAGYKYFIEAIMKQGSGGDNLAVAWQPPGGSRDVIAGQYISPYAPGTTPAPSPTPTPSPTPAPTPTAPPADNPGQGYIQCALENQTYTFNQPVDIAYGAQNSFKYRTGVTGAVTFNNATFGDPIPNVQKKGFYKFSSNANTITASEATYVYKATPTANYNSETLIKASYPDTNSNCRIAYVKFNTSSISGAISKATLKLYGKLYSGTTETYTAYGVNTDSWSESTLTWNNRPLASSQLGSATIGTSNIWLEFDVTNYINGHSDNTVTFLIYSTGSGKVQFNSDEQTSNVPMLSFIKSTSTLPPPTATPTPAPAGNTTWIEAEEGASYFPIVVKSDSYNDKTPSDSASGEIFMGPANSTNGRIDFDLSSRGFSGTYRIWLRADGPHHGSVRFTLKKDNSANYAASSDMYGGWFWMMAWQTDLTNVKTLSITYGNGVNLDKLCITSDTSYTPAGLGGAASVPVYAKNNYSSSAVATYGQLQVIGRYLCDSNGNPVQLRGFSTHGPQWFPLIKDRTLADIAQTFPFNPADKTGLSIIRIANYVENFWPTESDNDFWNGYLADPQNRMNLMKDLIDDAISAGVYIICNWHVHQLPTTPNFDNAGGLETMAQAFFAEMSATYGNTPNLIWEIVNEIPGEETTWPTIKGYAERMIPIIRQHSDNVVLVGTPTWCQHVEKLVGNTLNPAVYGSVMYSLHFYGGSPQQNWIKGEWILPWAINQGLPLFVSEFGTSDYNVSTNDYANTDDWMDNYINNNYISWVNWSFSPKDEASSALKPTSKMAGPWTDSDLTESGLWVKNRLYEVISAP